MQGQQLWAITQGGVVADLRERSSRELVGMGFHGYGIGGLSIGEPVEEMWRTIGATIGILPRDRPRYLMGVGSPREVLDAIAMGVDVFDSAFPTRNARHGSVLTKEGRYDITRGKMASDRGPLDGACDCRTCQEVDRAYVHHLWRSKDARWMNLVSFHNLALMQRLVGDAREAIASGAFSSYLEVWGRAGAPSQ